MSHYLKILFSALFVSFNVIIISQCCRRETNAVASSACNATGTMMAEDQIAASRHQRFPQDLRNWVMHCAPVWCGENKRNI